MRSILGHALEYSVQDEELLHVGRALSHQRFALPEFGDLEFALQIRERAGFHFAQDEILRELQFDGIALRAGGERRHGGPDSLA